MACTTGKVPEGGKLDAPDHPIIPFIRGDGHRPRDL